MKSKNQADYMLKQATKTLYEPLKRRYNIFILSLDQTDFVLLGDARSDEPHKESTSYVNNILNLC